MTMGPARGRADEVRGQCDARDEDQFHQRDCQLCVTVWVSMSIPYGEE